MKNEKLKTLSDLKLRTVNSVMRRGHPASSTYQLRRSDYQNNK